MNYLITGGTGFVGKNFIKSLDLTKDKVIILSRKQQTIAGCKVITNLGELPIDTRIDVVINLAGSRIDRRWSPKVKEDLLSSRLSTTKSLVAFIAKQSTKPQVFIQSSAIGYYGDYNNQTITETTEPKASFTNQICAEWEKLAKQVVDLGVRLCITRFAVVLGKNGGFIEKVYLPFKFGLGGRLGNGQQAFSWIHIDDVIAGMKFLINNENCSGAYNFASPAAVTNAELTKKLGKAFGMPTLFTMPTLVVKLLFGEMGEELLLKGNRFMPDNLRNAGFEFKYPELENALADIL